jgi:uncharacterized protein YjbI with pentapeptide repeats
MHKNITTPPTRRNLGRLLLAGAVAAGILASGTAHAAPTNTPDAPSNVRVLNGRNRIIAVWDAPTPNAVPATGYRVTATATDLSQTASCTTSNVNVTRCAINGLTPGKSFDITVATRSGNGDSSSTTAVNVMSWYQPQAPQGGTDFTGKDLGNVDLSWVNFTGANLTNANLNGSNARGANFKNATISGATFGNAELAEVRSGGVTGSFTTARQYYAVNGGFIVGPSVNLWNENLSGMNLAGQNFWGAQLSGANFSNANLTNANLSFGLTQATNFSNATMSLVNLNGTIMTGANFTGTSLSNAKIGSQIRSGNVTGTPALPAGFVWRNGHLVGANMNLWQANLAGQDLSNLNLTNVRAYEANLAGANLNGANVTGADLRATLTGASASNLVGNPGKLSAGHYMSGRNLVIPG